MRGHCSLPPALFPGEILVVPENGKNPNRTFEAGRETNFPAARLIGQDGCPAVRKTDTGTITTHVQPHPDYRIFRRAHFVSLALCAAAGSGLPLSNFRCGPRRAQSTAGSRDAAGDAELCGIY